MKAHERHQALGHVASRQVWALLGLCMCAASWWSWSYPRKWSEGQALHPWVKALFPMTMGAQSKSWSELGPQLCMVDFLKPTRGGRVKEPQGSCAQTPRDSNLSLL